jgi:hypothetical protein
MLLAAALRMNKQTTNENGYSLSGEMKSLIKQSVDRMLTLIYTAALSQLTASRSRTNERLWHISHKTSLSVCLPCSCLRNVMRCHILQNVVTICARIVAADDVVITLTRVHLVRRVSFHVIKQWQTDSNP